MIITETIKEYKSILQKIKSNNLKIAFVPTMGALHNGHLNLVKIAKEKSDVVVVSLFVNPTQFAPNEDFEKYPRTLEKDLQLCENEGVDIVFIPKQLEIYPIGFASLIEIKNITENFEGIKRPGHFNGVATIVAKLFNIIQPDVAVFGQKDYQQCLLIKKLVMDFNFNVEIIISPTLREKDGLAMSSRNVYLRKDDREDAAIIFVALEKTRQLIENGETDRKIINGFLLNYLKKIVNIKVDYAQIALANDLSTPDFFLAGDEVVILIAVYIGTTRLIDNSLFKIPSKLTF